MKRLTAFIGIVVVVLIGKVIGIEYDLDDSW